MQNWVWANWAPDLILPRSAFGSQPAGGSIGRSAAPMKNSALPPTLRPVGSVPSSRSRRAVSISVCELMSNTGLVSGWSPAFGSSPVSSSRLRMPSAAAPIISLCRAMRFLSRQVICRIGSMPAPISRLAAASALICARAPAPSVTLTASATPLSPSALRNSSCASHDTGGASSAVMTKRPWRRRSCSVEGRGVLSLFICFFVPGGLKPKRLYALRRHINSAVNGPLPCPLFWTRKRGAVRELLQDDRRQRHQIGFPRLLRARGSRDRALVAARAAQRPDIDVHQCRHGAVQERLHRPRKAPLCAGGDGAEMRACRRQAQRPRQCRLYRAPPHLLRNARQLFVRRLFQGLCDRICLGPADARLGAA